MSAISLVSNFLPPILSRAVHGAATAANRIKNDLSGVDPTRASARPDSGRLSPFTQVLSSLQHLQQSDPAKYKDVAQKIATNLQSAGQTAESNGDSASANLFNQLAGGFASASKTGDLPNIRDLAQAIKGHHRPHHRPDLSADRAQPPQNDPRDLLAAFKNNYDTPDAANPLAVIQQTLYDAGIDRVAPSRVPPRLAPN